MTSQPLPGLLAPEHVLERVIRDLTDRFEGVFAPETVRRFVEDSHASLAAMSTVTAHLPVLTARFATDRLTALGQVQGLITTGIPEVLFVCVHNAGRSQMAAALLAHRSAGAVSVRSAGSVPAAELEPAVLQAMAEIGVPLDQAFPKPLTDEVVRAADVVITMGCDDACPIYPGKRYEDWHLADPAGRPLDQVRQIRDDIDHRISRLITELTAGATP